MSKLGRGAVWIFLAGFCILVAACGGSNGGTIEPPQLTTPSVVVTPSAASITTAQALAVTVAVSGGSGNPIPTGSVILSSGSYASSATSLASGSASFTMPPGAIPAGSDTLSAKYTPDTAAATTYNSASGSASVTVTAPVLITSIAVSPNSATIGTQQQFTATVSGTGAFSKQVAWSLSCPSCGGASPGTLSTTGLYTTPYPAPPSVMITATSTQDQTKSGSATVTLAGPATATGPALAVDVNTPNTPSENPHTINPFVYGVNGYSLDSASAKIANPGLVRWGGDDVSRYNYKNHWTNTASDWYFENYQDAGSMFPNASSGADFNTFLSANIGIGAAALGTVPVLGWVANGANACSYSTSAFNGAQTSSSGYNGEQCGSGIWAEGSNGCSSSGGCNIQISGLAAQNTEAQVTSDSVPAPDITATSTPAPGSVTAAWADGTWPGGWVNSILTNSSYGNGASGKGVAMWDLDNEPTWWDGVHRDVHPVPFTYDEVTNNGIGTALAIKTADPTALVSGPVIDFWWAYFYSKKDIENGWSSGPCYEPFSNPTDREAHNGVPLIEYYLQQFQSYSKKYGVRLLDYLDVHGYFAPSYNGNSVGFTTAGDTQEQQARMNGTRVFWDPTYTDPNLPQPNYTTDPNYTTSCTLPALPPQLVPTLQKWTANDYPGTKTGIDEYNFGGLESINGAVVQADILGIFGRQGLDMSALWPTNSFAQMGPATYAFAMYRNYDLANDGAVFGDAYLQATSTAAGADAENQLAVYAAQRTSDHAVTVMVINKTYGALTSTLSLEHFTSSGSTAQVYQYSNANLTKIVAEPAVTITASAGGSTTSTITATFPGQSITLLVVPD